MKKEDPFVYAFWKYDLFPFVLGDQGRLLPNGDFKALGYGGATFARKSLIAIYPVELGVSIMDQIKAKKQQYEKQVEELKCQYHSEFNDILPELKFK